MPECARPIPTRILSEAKKSRFLHVIESWHELDFTRRQTAKNGGFVCRVLLNLRRVILNFWTIQRVKHMRIVSNSWQLRKMVRRTGIMQVIKPKTRGVNSGLMVTKLLAGGSLSFVCLNLLYRLYTITQASQCLKPARRLSWSNWTREVCAYGTKQNLESACRFCLD